MINLLLDDFLALLISIVENKSNIPTEKIAKSFKIDILNALHFSNRTLKRPILSIKVDRKWIVYGYECSESATEAGLNLMKLWISVLWALQSDNLLGTVSS